MLDDRIEQIQWRWPGWDPFFIDGLFREGLDCLDIDHMIEDGQIVFPDQRVTRRVR